MKRAVVVLIVVVVALIAVVPTFAAPTAVEGVMVKQAVSIKASVVMENDGGLDGDGEPPMESASDGRSYVTGY